MQRRQILRSLFAASLASAVPLKSVADTVSRKAKFRAALKKTPWLLGFRSVSAPAFDAEAQLVHGRLPSGLTGKLYRNGPAQHEIGAYRNNHWFDGNGMVQRFELTPTGVKHRARMIGTAKYLAERDAGRALYAGFASHPPNALPTTSPDLVNVANISVLPHAGQLLALWEAGSPWAMDPETLETTGMHSFESDELDATATSGLPFSAHPRVEPDGSLWNFGYVSGARRLVFWHVDARGKLHNVGMVPCDPISMPHDFVVTKRHLVLLIPPFHFEPEGASSFLDAHRWHPDQPTRVLLVDKDNISRHRWLELPAQWVFHFGNGWEDEAGVIRFDGARAPDPLAMTDNFRAIMEGEVAARAPTQHHEYRIDTQRGTITETPLLPATTDSEFPVVDPRVSGRRYSQIVMLTSDTTRPPPHSMLSTVTRFDLDSGAQQSYRYPDTVIPEEHLYVPKPGSKPEQSGWIIGTALNWQAARTELNVFEANRLADGPLATFALPYALPLGLHGKFF